MSNESINSIKSKFKNILSVIDIDNSTNMIQYDENASQWKEVGKIDCQRRGAGAVCINDKIYITGGWKSDILDLLYSKTMIFFSNTTYLKSCIAFKPNDNQSNGEIIQIADMNYPRYI